MHLSVRDSIVIDGKLDTKFVHNCDNCEWNILRLDIEYIDTGGSGVLEKISRKQI